jgi:hypothetical protein
MPAVTLIDTFPAFLAFWEVARHLPLEAQIDAWISEYMSGWPELLAKQQEDYASEGYDWRQVARERVFPHLDERLPAMRTAHDHLVAIGEPTYARAQRALDFDAEAIFLIYVGIGCGAGWVTHYQETPAVLFGLENVAEEGWTDPITLAGLVAHETGHLVHFYWRDQHGCPKGSGPWWQLYTEGFAQRCEGLILGEESWHMAASAGQGDWLAWCRANRGWLAAEFLRAVDGGEPVRPFFGSWFELRGRKQTGYFLGHEVIRQLEIGMTLQEIALLDPADDRIRHALDILQ